MITSKNGKLFINGEEVSITKITLEAMVEDAVERGSIEGLRFLEDESHKKVERQTKKGAVMATQSAAQYRAPYLKKYCGYVPASTPSTEKAKDKLFAAAFAKIREAKGE